MSLFQNVDFSRGDGRPEDGGSKRGRNEAGSNGEAWMTDTDDVQLKAEIDEIMKNVDNIMTKIETVLPSKQEEPGPQSDWSAILENK